MNKRKQHALIAQGGACNPRPIAKALLDAIDECRAEGVNAREDAATRLIAHQLTFLLDVWKLDDPIEYGKAMSEVES